MTDHDYLEAILEDQTLGEDSAELKALRKRRDEVETLLRSAFGFGGPSIKYGGSYKKGTMIRESYDLDLTCYFAHDDKVAGNTLQEIYESVENVLRTKYWTERKGSAIRIKSRENDAHVDFHIDVVPGRFVNGKDGDVNLHRTNGDKAFLKTNLDKHVTHVQDSGVIPAIRLMKLWALRRGVVIKTFALELIVIDALRGHADENLGLQIEHVMMELRDGADELSISDPANGNNDLSELLNPSVRFALEHAAKETLRALDQNGWEAVYGPVRNAKVAVLASIASALPVRPKPYAPGELA